MKIPRLLAWVLLLALCISASAQYGRRRATSPGTTGIPGAATNVEGTFRGVLKQLDKKQIVIENDDAQAVVIRRSKKTKFFDGGKEIKPTDIDLNSKVTIEATQDVDLKPTAVSVTRDPKSAQSPKETPAK